MFDWVYRKAAKKQLSEALSTIPLCSDRRLLAEQCSTSLFQGLQYLHIKEEDFESDDLVSELARLLSTRRKDEVRKVASGTFVAAHQTFKDVGRPEVAVAGGLVASTFHYGAIAPSAMNDEFRFAATQLFSTIQNPYAH